MLIIILQHSCKNTHRFGVLVEKHSQNHNISKWQVKADTCVILVVFHEERSPEKKITI